MRKNIIKLLAVASCMIAIIPLTGCSLGGLFQDINSEAPVATATASVKPNTTTVVSTPTASPSTSTVPAQATNTSTTVINKPETASPTVATASISTPTISTATGTDTVTIKNKIAKIVKYVKETIADGYYMGTYRINQNNLIYKVVSNDEKKSHEETLNINDEYAKIIELEKNPVKPATSKTPVASATPKQIVLNNIAKERLQHEIDSVGETYTVIVVNCTETELTIRIKSKIDGEDFNEFIDLTDERHITDKSHIWYAAYKQVYVPETTKIYYQGDVTVWMTNLNNTYIDDYKKDFNNGNTVYWDDWITGKGNTKYPNGIEGLPKSQTYQGIHSQPIRVPYKDIVTVPAHYEGVPIFWYYKTQNH